MEFWASSEVYQPAGIASENVRRCVEPFLNRAFAETSLADFQAKLRYVPIIMPEDMRGRYPARSRLYKKQRICDCAPQLDYDVFVGGAFEAQLSEYLRGIALSGPHLTELGATPQQIKDFEVIMESAADRILVERPDQTRQ